MEPWGCTPDSIEECISPKVWPPLAPNMLICGCYSGLWFLLTPISSHRLLARSAMFL